jgi:hypothetical protein
VLVESSAYPEEIFTAEIHVIAKETRTSKLIEISTEAVRAQQRQRASAEELAQIDQVKAQAYARQKNQTANTGFFVEFQPPSGCARAESRRRR